MSPFANAIYDVLRSRVPAVGDVRISYTELFGTLPPEFASVRLDSPDGIRRMSEALAEIVQGCRAIGLPCIAGLIVQNMKGKLEYPGKGYYPVAHPTAKSKEEQLALWGHEVELVKKTTYPDQLGTGEPQ